MKKLFFLCAAVIAMTAQAEVITLDLTTATDMMTNPVQFQTANEMHSGYSIKDVWDSTYSENWACQMIYCNGAKFMFSHMPSKASWGGISWEGFTVSRVAADTINPFACTAKGGLKGEATPFIIGYFSEYYTTSNTDKLPSSNIVYFDNEYYPQEVAICQNTNTLKALTEGLYPARPFTDKDTLTVIISGIDDQYQETQSVEYHLAVDGVFNKAWTKVNLSSIGKTWGLSFRMKSTDTGQYGINTPAYFALDGIKISDSNIATNDVVIGVNAATQVRKVVVNGQLYIVRDGVRYTMQGQRAE